MPRQHNLGAITSHLLVALAFVTGGCTSLERSESSYGSVAEAAASGAIDRGWLPADLPPSAAAIREWHDLDTNRGFGTLRFGSTDDRWVQGRWTAVGDDHALSVRRQPGDPDWWPNELRGSVDIVALRHAHWTFHGAEGFF